MHSLGQQGTWQTYSLEFPFAFEERGYVTVVESWIGEAAGYMAWIPPPFL